MTDVKDPGQKSSSCYCTVIDGREFMCNKCAERLQYALRLTRAEEDVAWHAHDYLKEKYELALRLRHDERKDYAVLRERYRDQVLPIMGYEAVVREREEAREEATAMRSERNKAIADAHNAWEHVQSAQVSLDMEHEEHERTRVKLEATLELLATAYSEISDTAWNKGVHPEMQRWLDEVEPLVKGICDARHKNRLSHILGAQEDEPVLTEHIKTKEETP